MLFHAAGDDVRAIARHPVPRKQLRHFTRVAVPSGGAGLATMYLLPAWGDLALVDALGHKSLYPGTHHLTVSIGTHTDSHGDLGMDWSTSIKVP